MTVFLADSAFGLLRAALSCVIGRGAREGRCHVAHATQPSWSAEASPREDLQGVVHAQRALFYCVFVRFVSLMSASDAIFWSQFPVDRGRISRQRKEF